MSTEYAPLAERIVDLVGGPQNIRNVFHCQTRLRFNLRDDTAVRQDELVDTDGVVTALNSSGMYQVVVGMHVKDVFDEVQNVLGQDPTATPASDEGTETKKRPVAAFIDFVAGAFAPVIPAIAGAGMVRAVLALLVTFGVISRESTTYVVLDLFAAAVFYFLPVLLAFSAATKLKCNPYLAASVAGIMLHPVWIGLVTAGEPVNLFEVIPLRLTEYGSTVIPILIVIYVQSHVERWLNRISPKSINLIFVPLFTFLIMGTLALALLGPIGDFLGGYLAAGFNYLSINIPWAAPTLIGALWPIMVMFGVHNAVGPLGLAAIATSGYDSITGPGILVSNISQGVAALVVAFRVSDPKMRQVASAGGITGLMGITEPALYGVNLPKRYPLVAAIIGGGAGGLFAGLTHTRRFAGGYSGLPGLPMYIGDDTLQYLVNIVIALIISVVVTASLTFAFSLRYERKTSASQDAETTPPHGPAGPTQIDLTEAPAATASGQSTVATLTRTTTITSPVNGVVIPLHKVPDAAFSSGAMGPGVGVEPSDGAIVAPCSGTVVVSMDTGHAFGIRTDSGVEVLVHVGVDTVQMGGAGFTGAVAKGTRIEAGQRLVTADLDAIAAAGHPDTVIVIVTNHTKVSAVSEPSLGRVMGGQTMFTVDS
ncbi:MAG: beta-glucoside-specific PTS transporter subunit IIABC [Actinomycetales bacterium]